MKHVKLRFVFHIIRIITFLSRPQNHEYEVVLYFIENNN